MGQNFVSFHGRQFMREPLPVMLDTGAIFRVPMHPVHGAFADGSSYAKVIPLLEAKGPHVTAARHPLSSLADDVATTRRVLADQNGPVILVGHSWAGTVIRRNDPQVAGDVYIATIVPDEGRTASDVLNLRGTSSCTSGILWGDREHGWKEGRRRAH